MRNCAAKSSGGSTGRRSWMRNCAAKSSSGSTGWRSWMRNCAAKSIPDGVIEMLHEFNSSRRAMACV